MFDYHSKNEYTSGAHSGILHELATMPKTKSIYCYPQFRFRRLHLLPKNITGFCVLINNRSSSIAVTNSLKRRFPYPTPALYFDNEFVVLLGQRAMKGLLPNCPGTCLPSEAKGSIALMMPFIDSVERAPRKRRIAAYLAHVTNISHDTRSLRSLPMMMIPLCPR